MVRIAIIGGGIGGLTTAITLRHFGFEPQVYEQAPALLDVGAAIALWPNATRVLQSLNLSEKILEKAGEMRMIQWLDQNGRLINQVSLAEIVEQSPAVALHRADLQEVLLQALPPESVRLGQSLINYNQTPHTMVVHFANGNTAEIEMLIGADGIHSDVRQQLLNDEPPIYRGYTVWRGIAEFSPQSIPGYTAIELYGKGKRFGIGPVGMGRIGWWATANARVTTLGTQREPVSAKPTQDTQVELFNVFDGWYRPVLQLIEATPSGSILKSSASDRSPGNLWGEGRMTLLGDAIHPMTPNFGQGGCMAIEDAIVLARCFEKYGCEPRALRRYEEVRRSRTAAITNYSRVYGSVGQWRNVWARGLRKSVLALMPANTIRRLMQIVFDYDACNQEV